MCPEESAERRAECDVQRRQPRDMREQHEHDAGDEVHEASQHDLERIQPLQLFIQRQAEDREHQDPLRGAEVAAVHAAAEHPQRRERAGALVVLAWPAACHRR